MINTAHWAASHRRSILFLLAIIVLGGVVSALQLPVALFPQVDFPRVMVTVEAGDQPAEQMAVTITRPLELAVRAVRGVRGVRSTTSRGSAQVSVNFDWGQDMVAALLQSESAINQLLPQLPPGTSFSIRRMDPTVYPVIAYSLTSDNVDPVALRDLAQYQLAPLLSSITGVASVTALGGQTAEYQVLLDPDKMQALGLSLAEVTQAVSGANVLSAVGRMQDYGKLYLLLSDTRLHSVHEIGDTVIRTASNGVVRLADIAHIEDTVQPKYVRVNADGAPAVLMQVYQTPGGNTVQIEHAVAAKLAAYQSKLPQGVKIHNWYDQSELIVSSAASVRDAIAIGVLLAALTLFLFLRSVKITLIALFVVPAVLAATALLLGVFGMSFNIMTLGGMAAAVGLIVDDVIVMIEHIMRRLAEQSGESERVARAAAAEFAKPLVGSSAATIVIFIPLAFLGGVTGAFFRALSLTMAVALFISFFVAWLVVPLLAEKLLAGNVRDEESKPASPGRVTRSYRRSLGFMLARPIWLLVLLVPLLMAGYFAYSFVGSGFIPKVDEGGFILDYRTPPGTSLEETNRRLQQVEEILQTDPAVATYSRRTGIQLSGSLTEANEGDFFVKLAPFPRAGVQTVMDRTRQKILHQVPGIDVEMALLLEDLIGDLTSVPQPIEIKLFDDDPQALLSTAPKLAAKLEKIPGVVDVFDGITLAGAAVNIHVERDKAALEGIASDEITRQVTAWLNGVVTTQIQEPLKQVGVRVWVDEAHRNVLEDIDTILLRAPDGHRFKLSRVAQTQRISGQPQIDRDNLKRTVAVTARISGRDLGSTIADVKTLLGHDGLLPKTTYYELGGLYRQQQAAFRGLIAVFCAALALVFVLILFLFESLAVAVSILAMPLLAVCGVFIGLWVTGTELNITAMMGLTMIIGIVTEVGIFYFSELEQQTTQHSLRTALVTAGVKRMRPITMTTLAAIFALLPLAVGLGQGSAMQQPLAIAIVSGLLLQLPLVLLVMPPVYGLLVRLPVRR